jgi:hypothetical protein
MTRIRSWATETNEDIGDHTLIHLEQADASSNAGVDWAASSMPRHYVASDRIAGVLARLGKAAAAEFLENKLPTGTRARSGELGEVIAAQYAARELGYRTITRLRWKDHREMAMRGDDIIGIRTTRAGSIEFLKGESKSRARLGAGAVSEADAGLKRDHGRPSPHALEFIADRLHERGDDELAAAIDEALLVKRIKQSQVLQLLFTFTGNNPRALLRTNTSSYRGRIRRLAVGLQVPAHQAFIASVYSKVIEDARGR